MPIDGIVGLGFEALSVKTKPLMDSLLQESPGLTRSVRTRNTRDGDGTERLGCPEKGRRRMVFGRLEVRKHI